MTNATLVLVSCLAEQAEKIAKLLIEDKLAACVTAVPKVTSFYTWQGNFHKEEESLLLIKTNESSWHQLEKRILELHTYEVPEIICLPITQAHTPYLNWLNESIGSTNVLAGESKKID
jgi:periplasmic divalent cation tolerance protein